MIGDMKLRSILMASVGAALLVAGAAVAGTAGANKTPEIVLAEAAYHALTAGRSAEAIVGYTQAIESRKLSVELLANALLNRALAHQNVGNHPQAIDDYAAALRIDAMTPRLRAIALYNRGLSNQKLDQAAQAIEDLTSALFLEPEFAEAYYSRANMLRHTGQFLFALGDYEKALRYSHPEPHLPLYGQALTYEALKKPVLAQKALARAIKVSPDFTPAREKLVELGGATALANALPEAEPAPQAPGLVPATDNVMTGSLAGAVGEVVVQEAPVAEAPPIAGTRSAVLDAGASDAGPESSVAVDPESAKVEPAKAEPARAEQAVAKSPEAEPEAETAPELKGWMVQLSSQRDEAAAWSAWEKLNERHGKLLSGHEAAVIRTDLGTKGIYYRLRIQDLESSREAQSLCSKLKSRGTSCFFGRAEG